MCTAALSAVNYSFENRMNALFDLPVRHMRDAHRNLRHALGMFATGIAVVTTIDENGKPEGLTVNSFTSLSLDPPLIIWNAGKKANCYNAFVNAEHFCVHILAAVHQPISERFATKSLDKFDGLQWHIGQFGSPVLDDYAVCFECIKEASHPGGDHMIFIGRIMQYNDNGDQPPLVYHRGKYRYLA